MIDVSFQNANVSSVTDSLDAAVGSVNSSCLNTLDAVTDQLGSIEGLNFEAQLLNVGVFNSCIYEYIDECQMGLSENECQTEYAQARVPVRLDMFRMYRTSKQKEAW